MSTRRAEGWRRQVAVFLVVAVVAITALGICISAFVGV
jgi:hypothetical protein